MDIVCFQETKMKSISNSFVQSLWGCPYVDSHGASGGILIMWDCRAVSRTDVCMGRFVVACFEMWRMAWFGLLRVCMA